METIVVGVDGSAGSIAALRWAIDEARLRGAKVRALSAWSYPPVSTYHQAEHVMKVPYADDAAAMLERAVAEAVGEDSGVEIETEVVESPAPHALVEAAKGASLLVVGSRGLGGFSGLLLGSVSQQAAHHSPCPLVIVHE